MFPAHPYAELFPLIEGEEFLVFAEDIRENGVRDPIVLLGGSILDGRNRANALARLAETGEVLGDGWGHRAGEPLSSDCLEDDYPWFRKFNRDIDGDPLAWVLSKNLKRRHLDESQRAMVAAKIANLGVGRPKTFEPAPDHIPSIGGISAQAAAKLLNVGRTSIERARSVLRRGTPELQHAVEQGRVAVSNADAIASLPKDEQEVIIAKSEKEILTAAKDIRARQRQVRFVEVNDRLARISEGNRDVDTSRRFPILYLDPASRFKSGFGDRSIENHYPTMEWPEIRALPIPQLATDIALMLCWSTVPQLANTIEAIKHWGFAYVSEWCWDKVDHGTGYWGFNQHEILLIAKRGKFPAPVPGTQPRSLYREKKTDHSAKPAWFAEQIERIWPHLPKVELFARVSRPGWSTWGNQSEFREPAKGNDPDQTSTGGPDDEYPSMEAGQSGELEAGETPTVSAGAPMSPALPAPGEPASVEGANGDVCSHAPPATLSDQPYKVSVQFSGGAASYVAAKLILDEFGHDGVALIFADTLIEDEDLYRFLDDAEQRLQHPVIRISEGRDPWKVFFDERMMGNSRIDPCSKILKRKLLDKWRVENCAADCTLVIGYDASEDFRFQPLKDRMLPVKVRAPLLEQGIWKEQAYAIVEADGLRLPRLYEMGFPHNNCGGFCVKAGQASFALLLENMPDRYAAHEAKEESFREMIGRDVSIMRDRRGGVSKPLTMRAFRERHEHDHMLVDRSDLGGCTCMEEPDSSQSESNEGQNRVTGTDAAAEGVASRLADGRTSDAGASNDASAPIRREEASGTAREAPSTGCGTSDENQNVGIQSAPPHVSEDPLELPDFLRRRADNSVPFGKGEAA